jgi:hypothetical protein
MVVVSLGTHDEIFTTMAEANAFLRGLKLRWGTPLVSDKRTEAEKKVDGFVLALQFDGDFYAEHDILYTPAIVGEDVDVDKEMKKLGFHEDEEVWARFT